MWPAVPTTTCRAALALAGGTGERPREGRDLGSQDRAAVEEETIVGDAADGGRLAGAERFVEDARRNRRGADRDGRGRQHHGGQRTAPHLGLVLDDARVEARAERGVQQTQQTTRARAHRGERLREHPERGHGLEGIARLVGVQRGLERGERELVDPERAVERVLLEAFHERAPPDDDAGLRPAEQLVPRKADEVDAGGDDLGHRRLVGKAVRAKVDERAGAEVLHHRDPALAAEIGQLTRGHRGREADHAVVRGVHLEEEPRVGTDRFGVVAGMRAVRGADLAQARAAPPHDVGDPELAADLDELAARDDDVFPVRQRLQRQQHGRRVVVDHERALGAAQAAQERLHVAIARAALLRGEVELQVRVRGGDGRQALDRERREQGATEVRVEHHARRVDHRAEREEPGAARDLDDARGEGVRVERSAGAAEHAPALTIEDVLDGGGQTRARNAGELRARGDQAQELVDRRQVAEGGRALSAHAGSPRPSHAPAR
jgi:hypothetical protein